MGEVPNNLLNKLEGLLDFDQVLKLPAKMTSRDDKRRTYKQLLDGRFDINVCRIDRDDDEDTISGKHSDFSSFTIKALMDRGEEDAIKSFNRCTI
jgi:hypothetical protein